MNCLCGAPIQVAKPGDAALERKQITGHLVDVHLVAPHRAAFLAHRIQGGEQLTPEDLAQLGVVADAGGTYHRGDPFGLDRNGITKHVEAAEPISQPIAPPATSAALGNQPAPPPPIEETPMARPCGHCQKVGHGRKDCPDFLEEKARKKAEKKNGVKAGIKKPGKRTGGGTRKKKRPLPAEPAVPASSNGHGTGINDTLAKKSGSEFLGHLKRVRTNLDELITNVETMLAVL